MVISAGRATHRLNIIGMDANAVIGARLSSDSVDIVGGYGGGARNDRGRLLIPWLHGQRLGVIKKL